MHWLIEMNVLLAVFAIIYWAAFRKDKLFHFNRAYLLAALALSAIVPHLTFVVGTGSPMQTFVVSLPAITVGGESGNAARHAAPAAGISIVDILLWIWIAGMAFMTLRFAWRWLKLALYIRKNYSHTQSGIRWVTHDGPICIAGPYLLAPKAWHGQTEHPVVQHELVHLHQWHTLDVILGEILTIVCWFNPFAYSLNRSLREVHEYLADDAVMQQHDIDRVAYCQWIIQLATRPNALTLAHTFSPSPIKNRLAMLHEQTHWKAALIKRILVLPIMFGFALLVACEKTATPPTSSESPTVASKDENPELDSAFLRGLQTMANFLESDTATMSEDEALLKLYQTSRYFEQMLLDQLKKSSGDLPYQDFQEGEVYEIAEEMPEYPGGMEALMKVVKDNIQYPEEFKDKSESQNVTVFIQFIVDTDGTPTNFIVLNADRVPPQFVKAALSGVSAMGNWKPGKQDGKPVAVRYHLPIRFAPPAE